MSEDKETQGQNEVSSKVRPYKVWDDRKDFYFDPIAAYNAQMFFETELVHVKGPLAGKPLKLERWQRRFIRRLYGWKRRDDDTRRYRTTFIFVPRKNGKLLTLDTPIPTPNGWATMEDLQVGDYVFDENGSPTEVVAVSEVDYDEETFEITFSNGDRIKAGANHEWYCNCGSLKSVVLTSQQIYDRIQEDLIEIPLTKDYKTRFSVSHDSYLITNIIKIDPLPKKCIQVENSSHLYLAGKGLIPTHNSFLGAGIALYGLVADGELGAECVSAAVDREQARVIFDVAKQIVALNPRLQKRIVAYSKTLVVHQTASKYSVLSADAENKHGSNPSTIVFDELHTQPNGDLVSVLKTGTGARAQPLTAFFTTAGFDRNSVCYEYYEKAKAVLAEPWRDPAFLPLIFEATKEDDWKDEKTWRKANPNYGVSINPITFNQAFLEASENPRLENEFKQLHLNMWTEQSERWLSMEQWDACGVEDFPSDRELREMLCVGGLDLSSKIDLTCCVLLFMDDDKNIFAKPYFWLPEGTDKTMKAREERDNVPYKRWAKDGFIELTPGDVIDYAYLRKKIVSEADRYNIKEIGFDPYRAEQIAIQLGQEGISMIEVTQRFSRLSEPSRELEALLQSGKFKHNKHPILRWNAQNAAVEKNAQGDIMPSKRYAKQRMDGIAAIVTGLSRLIVSEEKKKSKYEDEGLFML